MKDNSNITQELFEAIERYHNGTMAANELKDFNDYLKIDPEFRAQVEDVKSMLLGIETQTLKEQLDEFHKYIPKNKIEKTPSKKVRHLNYSKFAVAAAIVIAVGSIWFFSNSPNEKLYANYFKPDPGLPTTMSTTDNFDFYNAMVHYKYGDYDTAIDKWAVLSKKQPKNDTLTYFLGMAHLANKDVPEAIPFLERIVQTKHDFFLMSYAYFYLGLAYLHEGNTELAKKYLDLSNTEQSKEIIGKMN